MKWIVAIFTALILYFVLEKMYLFAGISFVVFVLALFIRSFVKKQKINKYISLIEQAKKDFADNVEFEPFLPINKTEWQVLENIPGISRPVAKMIQNRAKKQKFKDFIEYANFSSLEIPAYEINKKIIKF